MLSSSRRTARYILLPMMNKVGSLGYAASLEEATALRDWLNEAIEELTPERYVLEYYGGMYCIVSEKELQEFRVWHRWGQIKAGTYDETEADRLIKWYNNSDTV